MPSFNTTNLLWSAPNRKFLCTVCVGILVWCRAISVTPVRASNRKYCYTYILYNIAYTYTYIYIAVDVYKRYTTDTLYQPFNIICTQQVPIAGIVIIIPNLLNPIGLSRAWVTHDVLKHILFYPGRRKYASRDIKNDIYSEIDVHVCYT